MSGPYLIAQLLEQLIELPATYCQWHGAGFTLIHSIPMAGHGWTARHRLIFVWLERRSNWFHRRNMRANPPHQALLMKNFNSFLREPPTKFRVLERQRGSQHCRWMGGKVPSRIYFRDFCTKDKYSNHLQRAGFKGPMIMRGRSGPGALNVPVASVPETRLLPGHHIIFK
jgi:hypothetical protein